MSEWLTAIIGMVGTVGAVLADRMHGGWDPRDEVKKNEALLNNGSTQAFIARRYHTTEANLHHWLKQRDLLRPRT
jgi:hypothetical protein